VELPQYRIVEVSYKGTWSGPYNSGIKNAPIPGYLVEKYASKDWNHYKVRESIASVEALAEKKDGSLGINASNLILLLQGKVYEGMACNAISGDISVVAMREIKQSVRSRILELTIELEKRVPEATEVTIEKAIPPKSESEATVTQIFNQTVYGNVTNVAAADNAQVSLSITAGDVHSMIAGLVKAGLPHGAAQEFFKIVAAETPNANGQPGNRALEWIKKNAPKAASGVWKIGSSVATSVLTDAALKYYGLKP
jgi:hypothetical protein